MAMSKKHYEAVARRVKDRLDAATTEHSGGLIDSTAKKAVHAAMRELARDLAVDFREDNPNFDRQRFLTACGF